MSKWLLVVETNCADATREAEFHEWYNKTHLPDVLEVPGFTTANRYEKIDPSEGEAKFVAAYEIETDDIDGFMKAHNDNVARKRAEGRFSELLVVVSRRLYKQLASISR
ncbi:hypothetical protein ES707_04144 [subsurface metagenome]